MFANEIGIDKFGVVLDTDAWCRALGFALNEDGGDYGDWTDCRSTDMLQRPIPPRSNLHQRPAYIKSGIFSQYFLLFI